MSGAPPKMNSLPNPFAASAAPTSGFGSFVVKPSAGFGVASHAPTGGFNKLAVTGFGASSTTGFSSPANGFGAPVAQTPSEKASTRVASKSTSPGARKPDPKVEDELADLDLGAGTEATEKSPSPAFDHAASAALATNTNATSKLFAAKPTASATGFGAVKTAVAAPSTGFGASPAAFGVTASAPSTTKSFGATSSNTAPTTNQAPLTAGSTKTVVPASKTAISSSKVIAPGSRESNASSILVREQRIEEAEVRHHRWEQERAQHAHDYNKAQLAKLSDLVMLTRATQDACDWEAMLGLERRCLEKYAPIADELAKTIVEAELLVAKLRREHAILDPSSGARAGEDRQLSQVWTAKEEEFVDMFLRHRDRYLKLQQNDALRQLAEAERLGILAKVSEGDNHSYAHNAVSRDYLRPDF